jgi:hypothetical protein
LAGSTSSLKTAYDGGATIRILAESTGRSYGFVHCILTEAGTTLQGRGGAARNS